MKLTHTLGKFAAEAARAIRNFKYEITGNGQIYLPASRMFVGGVFGNDYAPAGGDFEGMQRDGNRVVTQGLIYLLNAALGGQTPTGQFYLAPFSGNVTPGAAWTGATFASQATEFTAYTAGNRLPWDSDPAAVDASIGNSGNLATSTITFNPGGPYSLYGVALLSASAKGATTGTLFAATRFANPRTNMAGGDKLALEYVVAASDVADA